MLKMTAVLAGNVALKQVAAVQKEWKKGLLEERNQIVRLYKAGTETWKEHHPHFNSKDGENQNAMWVDVWTRNETYWFVHESVSVLRAVFSGPKDPAGRWHPKTQPGRLASTSGRGRMVYASKEISLPPYEARKFTDKIIQVEQKPFQKRMEHATAVGARKGAP